MNIGKTVHPVNEILPIRQLVSFGLRHVRVMYAGAVAVPLILGSALGLTQQQLITLINANLLTSGVATLIQTIGSWKFGARLPLIQGCSFIAIASMIMIGKQYGLDHVFGAVIACGAATQRAGDRHHHQTPLYPGNAWQCIPIASVPRPVLAGCAIVMFGMTTVAGIQGLSRVKFDGTRNAIIVAVSVSVGVVPMSFPALFEQVSGPLKLVLDSGIFLGALTAILLNVLLNRHHEQTGDTHVSTELPVHAVGSDTR